MAARTAMVFARELRNVVMDHLSRSDERLRGHHSDRSTRAGRGCKLTQPRLFHLTHQVTPPIKSWFGVRVGSGRHAAGPTPSGNPLGRDVGPPSSSALRL